jgi:hypothetical protein
MRKLFSSRLLIVTIVLVVGVMLLGQSMGIAGPQQSAETAEPTLAASSPPQMEWSLAGLLLGGTLIALLRPRRRRVAQVTAE